MTKEPRFTLVFAGDIRKVKGNPHKIDTPFGRAVAAGVGDAFEHRDEILDALKMARECIAYCRKAHKDVQSGEGIPVEIFLDQAIAKAEGKAS